MCWMACFPSIFVFTFYCKSRNKMPYWSWRTQSLDFLIKARINLSELPRETKSSVFHSQTQLLLLCRWSDWLMLRAQNLICLYVGSLLGVQQSQMGFGGWMTTVHIVGNMLVLFLPDPYERLHITVYNLYHRWSYLKGLITFLGVSAVVISLLSVVFGFYLSI